MLESTFATTIIIAVAHFDGFIQFSVAWPYQEVIKGTIVCKRRFGTARAVIVVIVFLVGIIIILSGSIFGDRKVF